MSPLNSHTLRWRGGWARIGPFRSDAEVARLTMGTDAPPSPSVIERCLGEAQARSYKAVVTNALSQADSAPFVDAGFAVRKRLHLLAHDLDQLPPPTGSTRRARRHDHTAILDLDATAFDGDWHLDYDGLVEALRATPVTRFRVTPDASEPISGYAVTGRSGRSGYLQRIAVHADGAARLRPHAHRRCAVVVAPARRRPRAGQHTARQQDRTFALRVVRLPPAPGRAVRARADALRRARGGRFDVRRHSRARCTARRRRRRPAVHDGRRHAGRAAPRAHRPAGLGHGRRQPPTPPPGPGPGGGNARPHRERHGARGRELAVRLRDRTRRPEPGLGARPG